jgi:flagellar biosynthesis protein FlhG
MAELSAVESTELIRSFSTLAEDVDMMVVDMAPGISNQVIDFTHASQDIIVVICNDPASLMDSYAIIKILNQKYGRDKFGVLVNKVKSMQEGYDVFSRFQDAIARFIPVNMNYIGHVPQDDYITLSSRMGGSILDQFPHSEAAKAFRQICHGITHWQSQDTTTGGIQFFFERLIQNRPGTKEPTCIA